MDSLSRFRSQYNSYVYIKICTVDTDETNRIHMNNRKRINQNDVTKQSQFVGFVGEHIK